MHALILRRSITAMPLHLILVQAKLDCRVDDVTLVELEDQLSKF